MFTVQLLFELVAAHLIADFVLQPTPMGHGKSRHRNVDQGDGFPHWGYWLGAHGATHGLAVATITGVWWLGAAEVGAHCIIDFLKCERLIGFHSDQMLHLACKLGYAALLGAGLT